MENILLNINDRESFRKWLYENCEKESECWITVKSGEPTEDGKFYYIDAIEEALCFGWTDSIKKRIGGTQLFRFSPRSDVWPWTELNKERVRRLEKIGLMTDAGRKVLPPMEPDSFEIDTEIVGALEKADALETFRSFPVLYQRVRANTVMSYKERLPAIYVKMLSHLVNETKKGNMYGEWNDYGRLIDY